LEYGEAVPSTKRVLRVKPSEVERKVDLAPITSLAQPRAGSKLALVIAMLSNEAGGSLKSLAEMAGWITPCKGRATGRLDFKNY
jgi:hypothetical protein